MYSFSFPREEKLKHQRFFDLLFKEGKSKYKYPIRMLWAPIMQPRNKFSFLIGVTAPKKFYPKAYQRNRLKRQLREAYRTNKSILYGDHNYLHAQYGVLFIYTAKEPETYAKIENTMKVLLSYLHKELMVY